VIPSSGSENGASRLSIEKIDPIENLISTGSEVNPLKLIDTKIHEPLNLLKSRSIVSIDSLEAPFYEPEEGEKKRIN